MVEMVDCQGALQFNDSFDIRHKYTVLQLEC